MCVSAYTSPTEPDAEEVDEVALGEEEHSLAVNVGLCKRSHSPATPTHLEHILPNLCVCV
jgi:hypothetical protein